MAPTIVLHIGMNKTGTSAIQRFFNGRRPELVEQGLLYPTAGCLGEAHYDLSTALDFQHRPLSEPAEQERRRGEIREALECEIAHWQPHLVLLSSEFFTLPRDIGPVRDFFADWEVHILVYLRRHDLWWESAYAQALRMVVNPPWKPGPEAFIDWHRSRNSDFGDYRSLLERWAAVFGRERIVVRPYERQQNQPDLLIDLLTSIGAAGLATKIDCTSAPTNESSAPLGLLLADLFQRLRIDPKVRQRLVKHALGLRGTGAQTRLLSPAARRALIEEQSGNYAEIARTFMGRADGRLFYDPPPEIDEDWMAPELTPRQAVEETLTALEIQ